MTECKHCGPKQCHICGEHNQAKLVTACVDCGGEDMYYQLQHWRRAAVEGAKPRWWQRLFKVKGLPPLVKVAMELESHHAEQKAEVAKRELGAKR